MYHDFFLNSPKHSIKHNEYKIFFQKKTYNNVFGISYTCNCDSRFIFLYLLSKFLYFNTIQANKAFLKNPPSLKN